MSSRSSVRLPVGVGGGQADPRRAGCGENRESGSSDDGFVVGPMVAGVSGSLGGCNK